MEAAEFFETHFAEGNISKELQTLPEEVQVAWEAERVHPLHSPGSVAHDEIVCRCHVSPTHYEPGKQQLKPTAFQDAATFGLSVDRLKHASLESILAKAKQRVEIGKAGRILFGFSMFEVGQLRQVRVRLEGSKDPDRRGLGVYDTALQDEPEHADVCTIAPSSHGGRSVRHALFQMGNATHKLLTSED